MANFTPATIGNNYGVTIKKNNETVGSYYPARRRNEEINIEVPTALANLTSDSTHRLVTDEEKTSWNNKIDNTASEEKTTTTGKFSTINGGKLESCIVGIAPKQSLHGYDNPWVGGSGKNKLPMTVSGIKSFNTSGTWSGNDYTLNDVTFTILTDNDGNVTGIKANGTASYVATLYVYGLNVSTLADIPITSDVICSTNVLGSSSTYRGVVWKQSGGEYIDDRTVSISQGDTLYGFGVRINTGYNAQNLIFYPMIRLASVSDATFEPYTNICSITGHTAVEVENVGKNKLKLSNSTILTRTGSAIINDDNSLSLAQVSTLSNFINIIIPCESNTDYGVNFTLSNEVYAYGLSFIDEIPSSFVNIINNAKTGNSSNHSYICLGFQLNNGTGTAKISDIIIAVSSTVPNFEPYNGQEVVVNLGGTYYGGSLDVVSGVLTVDKGYADFGSLTWTYDSVGFMYSADIASYIKPPITVTSITDSICSHLEQKNAGNIYDGQYGYGVRTNGQIRVRYSGMSTNPTTFKSDVNGWLLVYELATPLTIQLTPQQINTLIGENYLDVPLEGQSLESLSYREMFAWDDVNDVVDTRLPISAIGTDESNNDTASKAYSQGDYFYKNGIAKAKTSIAEGATFTLNTNYEIKTLAEILQALEA